MKNNEYCNVEQAIKDAAYNLGVGDDGAANLLDVLNIIREKAPQLLSIRLKDGVRTVENASY